jgi:glycosyltransferase involved in cell wall biosynthesis
MYSGNMGLGHRFTEFLRAVKESGPDYEWRFHGGGKRRHEIENFLRRHPGLPISLGPYISRENLARHLKSAEVHLLSLEPTWNGTMVPSKLAAIFSVGRPVIFVGSPDCSIGQWIIESGGGWVVPPDNAAAMDAALSEALLPSVRLAKGKSAKGFADRFFDRSRNSGRIASIFSEAAGSTCEAAR